MSIFLFKVEILLFVVTEDVHVGAAWRSEEDTPIGWPKQDEESIHMEVVMCFSENEQLCKVKHCEGEDRVTWHGVQRLNRIQRSSLCGCGLSGMRRMSMCVAG